MRRAGRASGESDGRIDIGVATEAGINNIITEATGTGASGASLSFLTYDNFLLTVAASDPSPIDLGSATLNVSGGSSKSALCVRHGNRPCVEWIRFRLPEPIWRERAERLERDGNDVCEHLEYSLRRRDTSLGSQTGSGTNHCHDGGSQRRPVRLAVLCDRGVRIYLERTWARRIWRECPAPRRVSRPPRLLRSALAFPACWPLGPCCSARASCRVGADLKLSGVCGRRDNGLERFPIKSRRFVIASKAKQSRAATAALRSLDCFVASLLAMTIQRGRKPL